MKIAFVTPEMTPFAKTGGLADVCGALPLELAHLDQEVKVFMPRYAVVDVKKFALRSVIETFVVPLGQSMISGSVWATRHKGVEVVFIDNQEFFNRPELYGTQQADYPDNDRRFTFFQRAVLEVLKTLKFQPDIIHCQDWQTGLIPAYLKTLYAKDPFFKKTRSVFTIHNLAFQGLFPPDSLPVTGLGWEEFTLHRLEFWGKVSFLKGGLAYSDTISTVSKRYAQEIQTAEYGCGLEGVLQERKEDLTGIVNGIDVKSWNPESDLELYHRFSTSNVEKKKVLNKTEFQKEQGLTVESVPLIGLVSRLTDQKGMDILIPALEEILSLNLQLVILGNGNDKYHPLLKKLQTKFPKKFKVHLRFDEKLSRKIYGSCDLFLMPSRFEPCGLGQMIALRYGAVPVVRATGGLADTIENFNPRTEKGNGFCFTEYTSKTLLETIKRALDVYEDKKIWWKLVKSAMKCDFSWEHSASEYLTMYRETKKKAIRPHMA